MQVGSHLEEADLEEVPAPAAGVADVKGLGHIPDEVDQRIGKSSCRFRSVACLQSLAAASDEPGSCQLRGWHPDPAVIQDFNVDRSLVTGLDSHHTSADWTPVQAHTPEPLDQVTVPPSTDGT